MMDEYYGHIEMIIAKKKISNRLRFLLFDIQDLRKVIFMNMRDLLVYSYLYLAYCFTACV